MYRAVILREIRIYYNIAVAGKRFRSKALNWIQREKSCGHIARGGKEKAVDNYLRNLEILNSGCAYLESFDHSILVTSS